MVLAPNAGPMTHWGTNSYILGRGRVAIVDPGPADPDHLAALLAATKGETITHILVTHAHLDHGPLSRDLSQVTGAPIHGFGPPEAGRSPTMQRLAQDGLVGGGEGVDIGFSPDIHLVEGDVVGDDDWQVEVLHTPGHFAGHLAFRWGDSALTGDHVMDWSSSLVSPPDGDLRAFMDTSERLRDLGLSRLYPGHGAPIKEPGARLGWLIAHRQSREAAILEALTEKPQGLTTLTRLVYTDISPEFLPAANRNVLAHLIDLTDRNLVRATPELGLEARFATF